MAEIQRLGGIGRRILHVTPNGAPTEPPKPAAEPVREPNPKPRLPRPPKRERATRPALAAPAGPPVSRVTEPAPIPHTPIHKTTFLAALMLATVSGGYSIFGMASIFTGAMYPVIGMGVALEIGKLSAVSWFGADRGSRTLRATLFALVSVLMVLNAIGAYGFLAKAHIAQSLNGELATMGRQAEAQARIEAKKAEINDIDKRIAQIDDAVNKATSRGQVRGAVDIANAQRKTRDGLTKDRAEAMSQFTALQVEAASVAGQQKLAQADLGPALYLATLLSVDPDAMLRAFILLVAVLLDPAAVLLLMAATSQRRR